MVGSKIPSDKFVKRILKRDRLLDASTQELRIFAWRKDGCPPAPGKEELLRGSLRRLRARDVRAHACRGREARGEPEPAYRARRGDPGGARGGRWARTARAHRRRSRELPPRELRAGARGAQRDVAAGHGPRGRRGRAEGTSGTLHQAL